MTDHVPGPDRDPLGERPDSAVEQLLRAALTARAGQVGHQDLRPARPPAAVPSPRREWRHPGLLAAAAAVALAIGGSAVLWGAGGSGRQSAAGPPTTGPVASGPGTAGSSGPVLGGTADGPSVVTAPSPSPDRVEITGGPGGRQRFTLTLTPRTQDVVGTRATVSYPVATATGTDPVAARRLATAVNSRITLLRAGYRNRLTSLHRTGEAFTQVIRLRTDAHWGRTASIVLDDLEDVGQAVADRTSVAVVVDTATGRSLAATDLFRDVDAVDALMRRAVLGSVGPATAPPRALALLSMRTRAHGAPGPVCWYPTAEGLHWTVAPSALGADLPDDIEVTVGWNRLAGLLTVGARG